jgi:hypothetical protein
MRTFPDGTSLVYLASRDVRFIVMRQSYFERGGYQQLRDTLAARPELAFAGRFPDVDGEAVVFEIKRPSK